jgi:murein DD-endopeptidase MepM/ murein hydrolase activator NlpD
MTSRAVFYATAWAMALQAAASAVSACSMPGLPNILSKPTVGRHIVGFGLLNYPIELSHLQDGIDWVGEVGTPVMAVEDGIIADLASKGDDGNSIEVAHGLGLVSGYSHMQRVIVVKGQCVKKGEVIGDLGNTGLSPEPHLHLRIKRDGVAIDPRPFFGGSALAND